MSRETNDDAQMEHATPPRLHMLCSELRPGGRGYYAYFRDPNGSKLGVYASS